MFLFLIDLKKDSNLKNGIYCEIIHIRLLVRDCSIGNTSNHFNSHFLLLCTIEQEVNKAKVCADFVSSFKNKKAGSIN